MLTLTSSDLREVAAEAGRPAALGARPHAAHVLLTKDLVAALRVGAPRQVGAALHVASEQGILVLQRKRRGGGVKSAKAGSGERQRAELRYLGNGVLISKDVEEELGGGLSLAVCDGTVAAHHQVLLNPGREVLLPAGLECRTPIKPGSHIEQHSPTAHGRSLTLQQ